jgi:hypothetical protein
MGYKTLMARASSRRRSGMNLSYKMKEWLKKQLGLPVYWENILRLREEISPLKSEVRDLKRKMEEMDTLTKDLVNIGVDVHFNEPHMILIYSRLHGGQLRHVEANFKDMRDLNDFCRRLSEQYKTSRLTADMPAGMPREWLTGKW